MMYQIFVLVWVAALILALVALLTSDQFQQAFSGHNQFVLTAISVILVALGHVAKEALSVVSSIFREGLAPLDCLSVFIEDVRFEFPTIPDDLLHRSAGISELSRLEEDKFSSQKETLILTDDEAERINNLSKAYRYLNEVIPGEPYELNRIYRDFIHDPLYLSYRFLKLPDTMNAWADFLIRHKADNQSKKNIMESFISQEVVRTWLQFPELLKCLADLIFAREIKFELPPYHTDDKGYDLRLMSVATADGLASEGRNLVIVALVGTNLHIRIFDVNGKRVVDKAEDEFMSGETLTTLKKQLNSLPDESGLSQKQKQQIIRDATSIAGHTHGEVSPDDLFITRWVKDNSDMQADNLYLIAYDRFPWLFNQVFNSKKCVEGFVDLFRSANIDKLLELFEVAGPAFARIGQAMTEYTLAWNDILKNRAASSFVLTATLSNLGRFNSFVRSTGKVVIGPPDSQKPEEILDFVVHAYDEIDKINGKTLYIQVKSREPKTVDFIANLDQKKRDIIKGAYTSSLLYVRIGLLVSTGKHESQIVSPLIPFSIKARKQHDERVSSLKVDL